FSAAIVSAGKRPSRSTSSACRAAISATRRIRSDGASGALASAAPSMFLATFMGQAALRVSCETASAMWAMEEKVRRVSIASGNSISNSSSSASMICTEAKDVSPASYKLASSASALKSSAFVGICDSSKRIRSIMDCPPDLWFLQVDSCRSKGTKMLTRRANPSGWLRTGNLIDDEFNQCAQTLVGRGRMQPVRAAAPAPPAKDGRLSRQAPAHFRSGIEPDVLKVQLEGLVDAVVPHLVVGVAEDALPERLDDDAGILEDGLQVLHDLTPLFHVTDRERLLQLGVELGI